MSLWQCCVSFRIEMQIHFYISVKLQNLNSGGNIKTEWYFTAVVNDACHFFNKRYWKENVWGITRDDILITVCLSVHVCVCCKIYWGKVLLFWCKIWFHYNIYIFVFIVLTFRKIGHALLVKKCTHQRISRTFKRNDYLYFVSKY